MDCRHRPTKSFSTLFVSRGSPRGLADALARPGRVHQQGRRDDPRRDEEKPERHRAERRYPDADERDRQLHAQAEAPRTDLQSRVHRRRAGSGEGVGRRPRRLPERVVELVEQVVSIHRRLEADRAPRRVLGKARATRAGLHIQVIGRALERLKKAA